MKPICFFIFVTMFFLSAQTKSLKPPLHAKSKAVKMSQLKIKTMKYGQAFNVEVGVLYQFPDFKIQYLGITLMSEEAKREKEKSEAEGIDGGASMSTDSQDFQVLGTDDKPFYKMSMQMVPYAWDSFEYNKKKYHFEYDENHNDLFVMRNGPLMRDRKKGK